MDSFPNLPEVTDEMLEEVLRRTEGDVMSLLERQEQMVSFVWGNDLEGQSTMDEVRLHLNLN